MMTYNRLSTEIITYLNKPRDPDTLAQIPNIIENAHKKIGRDSKNIGFVKYLRARFTAGFFVINKPYLWLRNITFNYGTGLNFNTRNQIQLRSYEYLTMYWSDPSQTGLPLYYADYGYRGIIVAPTPNMNYPFEIAYLETPETLTSLIQTNWLTENTPDILLHACLLESNLFLKNPDMIPIWDKTYKEEITALNGVDDQRILDRGSNRGAD